MENLSIICGMAQILSFFWLVTMLLIDFVRAKL